MAAYERGGYAEAADYWQRLVAVLPAGDPLRATLAQGIARAEMAARAAGQALATPGLEVEVRLAPAVAQRVRPEDSVLVLGLALDQPGHRWRYGDCGLPICPGGCAWMTATPCCPAQRTSCPTTGG